MEESLDYACGLDDFEAVFRLVRSGAKITSEHIETAIRMYSRSQLISFLISNSDCDIKDNVASAIFTDNHEVLTLLLKSGREIKDEQHTPFHIALEMGRICCARLILEDGRVSWDDEDLSGKKASTIAVEFCLNSGNSGQQKFDLLVFCKESGFTAVFMNMASRCHIKFDNSKIEDNTKKVTMIAFLDDYYPNSNFANHYDALFFV